MAQTPHEQGICRFRRFLASGRFGWSIRPGTKYPRWKAAKTALIFGLALAILSGCAVFPQGGQQKSTAEPGALLFSDDFSSPPGGWGTWNRGGASVAYYNGGLRILVEEVQFDFWSVAGQKFADATIQVDATKNGGPDNNDFGLVCRYQNKDNFYLLVASSDGYYGIAKMSAGQYSMIGSDQLQYSSTVAHGQATNRLRADCVGSTLRLFFNGIKLMEARDSDFTSGDVGVIAGAYATPGVDILFDNFEVRKP